MDTKIFCELFYIPYNSKLKRLKAGDLEFDQTWFKRFGILRENISLFDCGCNDSARICDDHLKKVPEILRTAIL